MEASWGPRLRLGMKEIGGRENSGVRLVVVAAALNKKARSNSNWCCCLQSNSSSINSQCKTFRTSRLEASSASFNPQAPALRRGDFYTSFDGNWLLKAKGQEIASQLDGRSIFLVGMMGSGKTTVGRVLSEALDYAFVDSDHYVEQVAGGIPVAQIFQLHGESFFRDNESEALRKLSLMPQQVVATGGGAVVRPINWEYMRQGITVFLDVPLDALARRIAAVGTDSRPLLDFSSGDPYTKAFMGLFTLSKKRIEEYAHADVTVSLSHLADSLNLEDVSDLTPTVIAMEVLAQIEEHLRGNSNKSIRMFS